MGSKRTAIVMARRILCMSTLAAAFLVTGCKNNDTVTGPTVVVSTPTPRPEASLHGRVFGIPRFGPNTPVPVAGASITVQQGTYFSSATSTADGSYAFNGLVAGTVHVTVSARFGGARGASATLTLSPGENVWDAHL